MSDKGPKFKYYDAAGRESRGAEPPEGAKRSRVGLIVAIVVLVCVCGLGIIWLLMWRSSLYVKTVSATVRAAIRPLSSLVDARLKELHVSSGDRVAEGQVVARLDDSELLAALSAAEAGRDVKESMLAEAKAGRSLIEASINANIELAQAQVAVAAARVESAKAAIELRRAQLPEDIRMAEARCEGERATLRNLEEGVRSELIEAARERLAAAKALAALYAIEVEQSEELVKEGIDPKHLLQVKKTTLETQQNKVREAELELERFLAGPAEQEIEAARQVLAAQEAALALARVGSKDLDRMAADLEIRRAELLEARAELKRAEALRLQVVLADEEIKTAEAELNQAEAEIERSRSALQHMTIRSPVTGTVIRTLNSVGEVCRKGEAVVLVANDSEGRWIEGFVSEYDADRVKVGQPARVELIIGSGDHVDATVEAVALTTYSLDPAANTGSSLSARAVGAMGRVWVKLRPVEERLDPLPGMSARAVIRVR